MQGSLVCPVYDSLEGPYAALPTTVAEQLAFEEDSQTYPFCPSLEEGEDLLVVSEYSTPWQRYSHVDAAETLRLIPVPGKWLCGPPLSHRKKLPEGVGPGKQVIMTFGNVLALRPWRATERTAVPSEQEACCG